MKKFLLALVFCIAASASASAEDFEGFTAGDAPPDPPWFLNGGLTVRDSSTVAPFGIGNQYLETIGGQGGGDAWRFNQNNSMSGDVATTSFDFYWDEANNTGGNTNNWFRWALRGENASGDATINFLDVGTGPFRQIRVGDSSEDGIDFDFNTSVRFDIVYNISGAQITYNGGETLADGSYDVWIDGVVVENDFAMNRLTNLAGPPTNMTIQFLWHNNGDAGGGQNGLAYYDNFELAPEARVTFGMEPSNELGDFDGDGDVDLDDLDQYNGNIGAAATGALADLDFDGNGTVGENDFVQHYSTLVETSNGQTGTFAGDVNLSGTVDVLGDAFVMVANLNNSATSWSQGDINADQLVNVLGDAFLLVSNLGNSTDP